MNKKLVVLLLSITLGIAVAAGAYFTNEDKTAQLAAMTELDIAKLTCGACVSKIETALDEVEGVDQIDINVTNGRGQMIYDPALTSSAEIAKIISSAGYPASVRYDLSASEYEKSLTENEQLSAQYIARIGKRLLSREDFNLSLGLRGAGLDTGASPYGNQQLQKQVWQELKEREILMSAAAVNQIVVQDAEVDLEIKRMKSSAKNFDSLVVARYGSYERFFNQLKESLIINRNIEQNVIAGLTTDREKQLRFSQWYEETLQNTNVVIFDPAIKQAEASGNSSCGGSCGSK